MNRIRSSLPISIGVLLTVGISIILVSGYLSYKSLTEVVNLLSKINIPNTGLTSIKKLTTSIEQAENNIRLYVITQEQASYRNYKVQLTKIDSNLNDLYAQYPQDVWFRSHIDSIQLLINTKKGQWREMIQIWQQDAKSADISDLHRDVESDKNAITDEFRILKRIFTARRASDTLKRDKVIERLATLADEEKAFESNLYFFESRLASTNNKLNEAFIALMEQLEEYELLQEQEQTNKANELSAEAYALLAVFSGSGTLLGIFALILLIYYMRRNRQYQKVLVSSRHAAEDLAKTKEQFMANVSHEIRTPLNAISGFVKQILTMPLEKSVEEKMKVVDSAGDQLIRMINDVLDFTKLQSAEIVLQNTHFSADEVIDQAGELFTAMARKNNNSILVNCDNPDQLVLFGDKNRFQQIIYNLLSNAIKFTENGTISINTKITEIDGAKAKVLLEVKDSGVGIDSSKLEKIFQEYTQADHHISARYGGTGLGLSIVKKLVELFNGSINLTSAKGKGTTVSCTLQFDKGDPEQIEKPKSVVAELVNFRGLKVLIADDEEYNISLASMILKKWHVEYSVVQNGQEVIDIIQKEHFDLILMDIRMPLINGKMATQFIRETLNLTKETLPVIGVTADVSEKLKQEAGAWFNAFLVKPFSEGELLQLFNKLIPEDWEQFVPKETVQSVEQASEADLSNLVRVSGNDMNFVKEMIEQFEQTTLTGLDDMEAQAELGGYGPVKELAHKLIPACRHLGMKQVVNQLKELEELAVQENKSLILELISEVREATKMAVSRLYDQYKELNK